MSWHFLQEQEEASWAGRFLAGAPSVLLKLIPTPGVFFLHGSGTESFPASRSGTTFARSTASPGEGASMSSAEASPAKESAEQTEMLPGFQMPAAGSGANRPESLEKLSLGGCSSKTVTASSAGASVWSCKTFPRWGMMRNGELFPLAVLALHTREKDSGSWPTPTATDYKGGTAAIRKDTGKVRMDLVRHVCKVRFGLTYPIPEHSEALMLWPIGWTDLKPLAMDRFQQWQRSHGGF